MCATDGVLRKEENQPGVGTGAVRFRKHLTQMLLPTRNDNSVQAENVPCNALRLLRVPLVGSFGVRTSPPPEAKRFQNLT